MQDDADRLAADRRARETMARMDRLDPGAEDRPDVDREYARFRGMVRAVRPTETIRTGWRARFVMMADSLTAGRRARRWRPVAVSLIVVAGLAGAISYAPARQKFVEILGIFRVKQFSPVTVDHARMEQLQRLQQSLKEGGVAQPVFERQRGTPRLVGSAAEASSAAGFRVREPAEIPAGAVRDTFSVASGPAVRVQFDRDKLQAQLAAAGLSGITLPPMPSGSFRVDVASVVCESYRIANPEGRHDGSLRVVQLPSPSVTLPPGTDAAALGETLLEVLGLPPADAHRLAERIDWTSTLVVPMPADLATFREVTVDGADGLYVEQSPRAERGHRESALIWQRDDIVYALKGENIAAAELLKVAESLR